MLPPSSLLVETSRTVEIFVLRGGTKQKHELCRPCCKCLRLGTAAKGNVVEAGGQVTEQDTRVSVTPTDLLQSPELM